MKTKQEKTTVQILRYFLSLKNHLENSNNIMDRNLNVQLQKKYRVPWNAMRLAKEIGLICNPKPKVWLFIYTPDIVCANKILEIRTFLHYHPDITISEINNYPECKFTFKQGMRRTKAFMSFFRTEKLAPINRPMKDKTRRFKGRKPNTSDALLFTDEDLAQIDENFTDPFNREEPIVRDYALEETDELVLSVDTKRDKPGWWITEFNSDQEAVENHAMKIEDKNNRQRKKIQEAKEVYLVTTHILTNEFTVHHPFENRYESWHDSYEEAEIKAKQEALNYRNEVIYIMKCVAKFKSEVSVKRI
jgi:hypothetical protein